MIIKASSPVFMYAIAVGNVIVFVHVLVMPEVWNGCVAQVWTLAVGLSLVLSAILAKVRRGSCLTL